MKLITSLMLAIFVHQSAFATTHYSNAPLPKPSVHFMTAREYHAKMKIAKSRKPDEVQNDTIDYATAFSDSYKNLEAKIIGGEPWANGKRVTDKPSFPGIKTAYDMDTLLTELAQTYTHLDPDAKFVGAGLLALRPWRAFAYRIRPLLHAKSQFTHAYLITVMRALQAGLNTYLPTKEWQAAFDYMTQPYPGADKKLIKTDADLYNFVRTELLPAVNELAGRVSALNFTTPIYFDNKLFYSDANFASTADRYVRLGEAERQAYLSGVYISMSGITFSMAYEWSGLLDTIDHFAMVYGINSQLRVDSMTSRDRVRAMKRHPELFTLRKVDGSTDGAVASTEAAYSWYLDGIRLSKLAWVQLKHDTNESDSYSNLFDPRGFVPFTRILDTTFNNLESLTSDKGITSAIVAGETVQINFKKFFFDPPADMKAFLPTSFKSGPRFLTEQKSGLQYRNYDLGNPNGWDVALFGRYFPGIHDNAGVRRAARVLSQSWGGWVVGVPFSTVMF